MEDLPGADSPPITDDRDLPEANNDPQDPLAPSIDEEDHTRTPPIQDPNMDMEATEDDQAPIQVPGAPDNDDDPDSDALSEVDEAQFEDFDPNAIAIEERPRVVDASGIALLGKHKRKREDGDAAAPPKKKKEGRREKPKRSKKNADAEDDFEGGEELDGKRSRKSKAPGEKVVRRRKSPSPDDDVNLTPEERKCTASSPIVSCTVFTCATPFGFSIDDLY